jgi:general secretion pathway protein A
MYLNHFNLREKPFNISPDSRFFWVSEKHKEGLAALKYAILEDKGFLLLTGDVGTGKTLLIKAFTKMSGVKTLIATIPDPDLVIMDFFKLLAEEFKMNKVFFSKGEFLIQFKQFLLESYGSDKKVLLIIDEAQRLNSELLEQIRLLSNIEMDHRKLISIFFVGQSEFNQMLMEEKNRAVRQRIAVNYELKPLTAGETAHYIRHRLMLAGALDDIFKPDAVREVFTLSRGYPRLINIICDYALVTGYSAELKKIGAGVIKECGKELHISIGIDKIRKEQSNQYQQVRPLLATATREKPRGIRYGFAFIIMMLFVFVGLQIYGSLRESPPRWSAEDFAPIKQNRLLEKQREAFKAEIENGEKAMQNPPVAETALQADSATEKTAEASLDMESDINEEVSIAESPKSDSDETQPTGFIADQRSIIYFEHNSNELPPKAYETLDNIVKSTSQRPDLEITVEGYTDSHGDPVYNRQLSKYRADMVKNYLIGHGVAPANIIAIGRGPANPIQNNKTFEGRKQNRRVEIQVKLIR